MILVDTTVWIDHLRGHEPDLMDAVNARRVLMHPMVIGELVCGNLPHRKRHLATWGTMPMVEELGHEEVLSQIESRRLMGRGIGFVDAHVLCACLNSDGTLLWSRDKSLRRLAEEYGVAFPEPTREDA